MKSSFKDNVTLKDSFIVKLKGLPVQYIVNNENQFLQKLIFFASRLSDANGHF